MDEFRNRVVERRQIKGGELLPNAKNWRTHPAAQSGALKGVLREIGKVGELYAYYSQRNDGKLTLIDGHLRGGDFQNELWDVAITDLNDEEADKLLASYDPLAAMAGANAVALKDLLDVIKTDDAALQALFANLVVTYPIPLVAGVVDPEAIPEPPDTATTRPGDLYHLGNHRLLCGDSSKAEDLDRLLGGAAIHLVNTDPPYNVKVEPRSNNAIAAGLSLFTSTYHHQHFDVERHPEKAQATTTKLRAKDRPLANDFISDLEFERMLLAWFGNIARVLVPGRGFYIWGGGANCGNYPPALKANDLYFSQAIIWDKQHPVLTRKDFMGAHEWCFYGWKKGAAHQFFGPNNATDLWAVKKINPQSMIHLTEKPVELAVRAMEYSSRQGENVLDLFGGSGSTLIAAQQTGRKAYLMELDPLYCDVIVSRWQSFTGSQATVEHA